MNRTLHTVFNVLIALALLISFSVQPAIGARMETESIPPATPEEISENNPIYLPVLAVEAMQIYQITGRVTDGNDNPVSGVTISSDAGHTAVTDGEGKYVLSGFSEGLYALNVQSDSVYCSPLNMLVNVPPNTPQKNFTCSSDLYPVAGTILDKEGNPVEGATVSDNAGRATLTDASGNYQMELPAGIYTLTPSYPDKIFDPASFTVRVGSFKARTPANAVQFTALSSTWTPMNLAAPLAGLPELTDRNMKVDKSGRVHIVFDNGAASGTETLYYGLYDGTAWTFTQLDAAAGTGMYASIALDSKNLAHVAYYDSVNKNLKYIRQMILGDGTVVWDEPTVAAEDGNVGKTTSIAIDSDNRPHIVYLDDDTDGLMYTYSWFSKHEKIDVPAEVGDFLAQFPSLALTANNTPYVSYYKLINLDDETDPDGVLMFAYRTGEDTWITSTVATGLFTLETFQTLRQSPLQILDITVELRV
jgi:hypothetical protein